MSGAGTTNPRPAKARPWTRALRWVVSLAVVVTVVVILWNAGQGVIDGQNLGWQTYLLIGVLVFGDAICPVLPGETTLNAGSVLAAAGSLQLWLVVLAGALGAIAGDSTLYWLARKAKGKPREWLDRAASTSATAKVLRLLDQRGTIFLLFGRYIPGIRFALNVALGGVVRMPYGRFIGWSALSGTLWSLVTCAAAYGIGHALAGYPLLSLILTCTLSTALISGAIWVQSHFHHGHRDAAA